MKKIVILILGVSFTYYFMKLTIKKLDWNSIWSLMITYNVKLIFMAIFSFFIGYFIRSIRWKLLCQTQNVNIDNIQSINNLFQGTCINNIIPFRAGDIFRVYHTVKLNKEFKILHVVKLILLEKVIDLVILLGGLALLMYINVNLSDKILNYLSLVLVSSEIWFMFFAVFLIIGACLAYWHAVLKNQVFKIFYYIQMSSNLISKILLCSLLAWLFEFIAFAIIAFGLAIPNILIGAWGSMILGTLAAMLPSLPGYFGTFDFFALLGVMSVGADSQTGGGFLVLIRLVIWLPITLIGIALFAFNHKEILTLLRRSRIDD